MKKHEYGKTIVFRYGAYKQCFNCGYQAVSEKTMYKEPCNPIFAEGKSAETLKDLLIELEDK